MKNSMLKWKRFRKSSRRPQKHKVYLSVFCSSDFPFSTLKYFGLFSYFNCNYISVGNVVFNKVSVLIKKWTNKILDCKALGYRVFSLYFHNAYWNFQDIYVSLQIILTSARVQSKNWQACTTQRQENLRNFTATVWYT